MTEFFIPYSRACDFWNDTVNNYRSVSDEFWNWAEIMLGQCRSVGEPASKQRPWCVEPHNQAITETNEDGTERHVRYENGRLISFYDDDLAMLFKLRWL